MSHLDPDQIALLALGEPVATPGEQSHLGSCAVCAAELADMTRTVSIARTTIADAELEAPPDAVWDRVVAELGMDASSGFEQLADETPESTAVPAPAPVSTPPPRRWSTRALWALAAAVVIVAGVGVTVWAVSSVLAPTSIATASLDAFPAHPDAVGSADVEESRDGSRTLVVSLDSADADGTFKEVWLIRNDAAALVSLGVLEGSEGSFLIPAGLDLEEYSLVDISVEPLDGDPAHSGDSIVRGQLAFA